MSIIQVKAFGGTKPRVSERLLDNSNAQTALNCDLDQGSLRPLKGPLAGQSLSGQTIFKHKSQWLSWAAVASVVRTPVSSDNQRIAWTGDEYPKVCEVTSFPSFKRLGVLAPTVAPSVAFEANPDYVAPTTTITAENFDEAYYLSANPDVAAAISSGTFPGTAWEHYSQYGRLENRPARAEGDGVPDEEEVEIVRSSVYAYTAVNEWGEESKLSPPSPVIEVRASQLPQVQGLTRPSAPGLTVTKFRIYRVAAGSSASDFQFVAEIDSGLSFYKDTLQDAELGEVCPTAGYDAPPDDLQGIIVASNGLLFGFRRNEVYPSEQFVPYAFPRAYMLKTESDIIGLGCYGNTVVACTATRPYAITGINPEAMNVLQLPFNQSCLGAGSIVSVEGGVLYASPDGLFMVSGNGSGQLLTASILTKEQWASYAPDKIIATWFDNKYYAFQRGTGKGFILNIERGDLVDFDLGALEVSAVHYSPWDDKLYLLSGGNVHAWGAGADLTYVWKSKCYSTQTPIPMSSGRVFGGAGNTVKYFANGSEIFSATVTDREVFRLPGGALINEHEFQVSGTAEIHEVKFATSNEEMGAE